MDGCISVIAYNLPSIWELSISMAICAPEFRMIEKCRCKGTMVFINTDTTFFLSYLVHQLLCKQEPMHEYGKPLSD